MGLFWSVQPDAKPTREVELNDYGQLEVIAGGKTVASTAMYRSIVAGSGGYLHKSYLVADHGFDGEYFPTLTRPTPGKHTAIVVLGGSEGGTVPNHLGELLAAHGYPTLLLAYFRAPGLPQELSSIPLEYFARAITWFAQQDQVDPARIVVMGISRGSEAALLLGANYPRLVHGLVAAVPTDVVHCARPIAPAPTAIPSSWTLHGKPIPCTNSDSAHPYDTPGSVIPVERTNGPVFAYCGEADSTWPSCTYADAIFSRLSSHSRQWHDVLTKFPGAGHFVGFTLPYDPVPLSFVQSDRTYTADRQSLATVWPQLLSFLGRYGPARVVTSA
jgi:pimeloyl-ACP methyl ester carboxylesterase